VALAIDASSPALTTQTNTATATLASGSFTPPAGSVLLIQWSSDGGAHAGLTDDHRQPRHAADLHAARLESRELGHACCQRSGGDVAGCGRLVGGDDRHGHNGAVTTERAAALKITVLTGADTTTPIGAHNKSGSLSTASIAQTYTATSTGGWGFIVVCDFNQLGNETAGTGCTLISTGSVLTNISYGFFRRTTADDVATNTNTLNVTIPGTTTNLSWTYAEVLPAVASTAVFPPNRTYRRRLAAAPRLPRGRARISTPVRAQVNPPFPFTGVKQPRQLRGLLGRHVLRRRTPIPAQVDRHRDPRSRRQPDHAAAEGRCAGSAAHHGNAGPDPGHGCPGVPAAVGAHPASAGCGCSGRTPPSAVFGQDDAPIVAPQPSRLRLRGLRVRSHPAAPPTVDQLAPAGQRPRLRLPRLARGRTVTPTTVQITATPPAYPPLSVRTRLRGLRLARGRAAAPVPGQIVVVPPAYPHAVGAHEVARPAAVPRPGGSTGPAADHGDAGGVRAAGGPVAAEVPEVVAWPQRRPGHRPGGPAAAAASPPADGGTPTRACGHAGPAADRGGPAGVPGAAGPVPAEGFAVASAVARPRCRCRRRSSSCRRSSRPRSPASSSTPPGSSAGSGAPRRSRPCVTATPTAPATGTTGRPGTGITGRPGSGATARPSSGMTLRTDDGTTAQPCTCNGGG
jgi:hypothetical protein